jgi:hypothetical protein
MAEDNAELSEGKARHHYHSAFADSRWAEGAWMCFPDFLPIVIQPALLLVCYHK